MASLGHGVHGVAIVAMACVQQQEQRGPALRLYPGIPHALVPDSIIWRWTDEISQKRQAQPSSS
jgi:hypothetical protein